MKLLQRPTNPIVKSARWWILGMCLLSGTSIWAKESALLYNSIEDIAKKASAKVPTKNGILVLDLQDFDGRVSYLNRYLTDQMTIALSNTVDVTVVDRQILKTILEEKKIAQAGLVDDTTAMDIGKMVGAKSVIYGTAMDLPKTIALNIKVVNIEKGIVVGGVVKEIKKTRSVSSLIKSLHQNERESKNSTALQRRVEEIQMEIAIKERMKRQHMKQEGIQEASVWEKLQQSVDLE